MGVMVVKLRKHKLVIKLQPMKLKKIYLGLLLGTLAGIIDVIPMIMQKLT